MVITIRYKIMELIAAIVVKLQSERFRLNLKNNFNNYLYNSERNTMAKRKRKLPDKAQLSAPRNPLFNHPLMRKSHVHDKSHKAKRRADKVRFNKDWYSQSGINILNTILRIPVFN